MARHVIQQDKETDKIMPASATNLAKGAARQFIKEAGDKYAKRRDRLTWTDAFIAAPARLDLSPESMEKYRTKFADELVRLKIALPKSSSRRTGGKMKNRVFSDEPEELARQTSLAEQANMPWREWARNHLRRVGRD